MGKQFVLYSTLVQLVLTALISFIWPTHYLSLVFGSSIVLANFLVLSLVWYFIFYKKRVAPSFGVVVIKYGILIFVFSKIPEMKFLNQDFFGLGILLGPVSIILGAGISKVFIKK